MIGERESRRLGVGSRTRATSPAPRDDASNRAACGTAVLFCGTAVLFGFQPGSGVDGGKNGG